MDYQLGKNKEFYLSAEALNHIINGDISERQDKDAHNKTILTKVLSGGLHTFSAWENFLLNRNDITHALLVPPEDDNKWYYARKLQNDVILLKIPRDCFQSKAANITKFPETYYKSGYLWKTLFPQHFTKDLIISSIDEALHNLNNKESKKDLLIGYCNPNDLFKCIKIRIQIRETEILSAFPTWEQPMTGNNGKPFSHIDSINTIISSSCVFALNHNQKYIDNTINKYSNKSLDYLKSISPEFIINRKPPKKGISRKKQYKDNIESLRKHGESLNENKVIKLCELATSDEYSRNTIDIIRYLYHYDFKRIKESLKLRNVATIYENLKEILIVVNGWDLKNNNNYAFKIICHILKIKFIRTGGVDQWETKRLATLITQLVLSYQSSKITLDFLHLLNKSPIRIAFFLEFNLNQFFVKDPVLIGFTGNDILPLEEQHFYNYVSQNLGINYTINFDDEFNFDLSKNLQKSEHLNGLKIVKDIVSQSVRTDFNYFAVSFDELVRLLDLDDDSIKLIDDVLYNYYRCTAANIQRTLAKNKLILGEDIEYGDKGFDKFTKAKHEYKFLWVLNKIMIDNICEILSDKGRTDDASQFKTKYLSIYKEVLKIPMPSGIPKYLETDEIF